MPNFHSKYGNIRNFEYEHFLFPFLLRQQKLFDYCCEANDIYPDLVRNLLTSHVKGKDIVLDTKTLVQICCDIPMEGDIIGFGLVCEWDDYDRKRFYISLCRISKEEIEQRKQQGYGETVKNRDILSTGYLKLEERLLHYFMSYNHSQISDIELQLIKCGPQSSRSKIDIEVVYKMGFNLDPVTRRTYKHRTDPPTAPTEQPEPTIPD
ncbi:hypothetical protein Lal_00043815 [Lupinus albus]|nr:hypothetical protein Lal_00043815 [Lupinus albus]